MSLASVAPACRASTRSTTAGFWFDDGLGPLPSELTAKLGGPLTQPDLERIEALSRSQLRTAFAGLRITVTPARDAFWRVQVSRELRYRGTLASTGESLALGPLGGIGEVNFPLVVQKAVEFAPRGASRQTMVDGIGRGIGRVAVHEFFHQILGPGAKHNDTDPDSYESGNADRASQYYGNLHWTIAWPLLQKRLG